MDKQFLAARADRINAILDRADEMGDGAASLGTMVMLYMSDEQYETLSNPDVTGEEFQAVMDSIEKDFNDAGIKTSDD